MKKITIKSFVQAIGFKLGEGYEYQWACHGPNAYGLGWEGKSATAGIVYDTKSGVVYSMEVWDTLNDKIYRWISPDHVKGVKNEYGERGLNFRVAIDKTKYEDVSPAKALSALKKLVKRR
jgi:hypothetical protein